MCKTIPMKRCQWAKEEPNLTYHDKEWGRPEHDDKKFNDPTCKFLQVVANKIDFKHFYFGHFHRNKHMGKFHCLYEKIERIV